jgi:hypothetical protein
MQVSAPISSDKTEPQQTRTHPPSLCTLFSSSILCCPTLAVTDAVLVALYSNGLLQKLGEEICCCARWSHIGAEAPALAAAERGKRKKKHQGKHVKREECHRQGEREIKRERERERERER